MKTATAVQLLNPCIFHNSSNPGGSKRSEAREVGEEEIREVRSGRFGTYVYVHASCKSVKKGHGRRGGLSLSPEVVLRVVSLVNLDRFAGRTLEIH